MAIWQFGINLISREKIENHFGETPLEIERAKFYDLGFHQGVNVPENYENLLNTITDESKHWCEKARIWGKSNGNHIDVWNFSRPSEIEVFSRLHVGDWDRNFVEKLLEFAKLCDSLLLTKNDSIIEPKMDLLIEEVLKSNSYRFCKSPIDYIQSDEVRKINEEWKEKFGETDVNFLEPVKNVNLRVVKEIKKKLTE